MNLVDKFDLILNCYLFIIILQQFRNQIVYIIWANATGSCLFTFCMSMDSPLLRSSILLFNFFITLVIG